jgi:hypothetical protein
VKVESIHERDHSRLRFSVCSAPAGNPSRSQLKNPKRQRAPLGIFQLCLSGLTNPPPLFCKCVKNVNNLETRG